MKGILFIGVQASGKSSFFAHRFAKTHLRLSMDMLKTRHREKILLEACLKAKQPFVIDNTNPTRIERQSYIEKMKAARFEVIGYYFKSNIEACLTRNRARTGKESIPEVGLLATYKKLELPTYQEGFDQLFYVRLNQEGFEEEVWQNEV